MRKVWLSVPAGRELGALLCPWGCRLGVEGGRREGRRGREPGDPFSFSSGAGAQCKPLPSVPHFSSLLPLSYILGSVDSSPWPSLHWGHSPRAATFQKALFHRALAALREPATGSSHRPSGWPWTMSRGQSAFQAPPAASMTPLLSPPWPIQDTQMPVPGKSTSSKHQGSKLPIALFSFFVINNWLQGSCQSLPVHVIQWFAPEDMTTRRCLYTEGHLVFSFVICGGLCFWAGDFMAPESLMSSNYSVGNKT